jgi:hypothetical protein
LPQKATTDAPGTKIELVGFRPEFAQQVSRAAEAFVQKLIEHFILILLEPRCPKLIIRDLGIAYDVNAIFAKDYRASASVGRCVIITSWPFEFDCRDRAYRMFRGIGIRENDLFVENDDVSTLSGFRTKDF